jgi:Ca2+-binding EF-hand superfamily protein
MADIDKENAEGEGEEEEEADDTPKFPNLDGNEAFKEEVLEVFDMFDKEKNEHVPTTDLQTILQWLKFNPTTDDLKGFKDRFDPTHKGEISQHAVLTICDEMMESPDTIEQLEEALTLFDHDNDGKITVPEFRWAMSKLGDAFEEKEVDEIIKEIDKEGTGFIEILQFCKTSFNVKEEKIKEAKFKKM